MLRFARCCWIVLALFARATYAEPVPFEGGRLALQFGPLYGLEVPPTATAGATGTVEVQSTASGAITRIEFPAGVFVADAISIPFVGSTELQFMPPVGGVQLTFANEAGVFTRAATPPSEVLRGVMPLAGVHKFCVFFVACGATPTANVTVPLSVIGEGGTTMVTALPQVTLSGGSWSTGTVTVDGADQETGMIAGTIQAGSNGTLVRLVTPVFLSTNTVGTYPSVRGLGVLTFLLIPEPDVAALLAASAATLVMLGWRRRRMEKTGHTS